MDIITFIETLKGHPNDYDGLDKNDTGRWIIEEIFTRGNCGNFALILNRVFGGSFVMTEDNGHVMVEVDGRRYDITGDVTEVYTSCKSATLAEVRLYQDNYSFVERGPIV